MLLDAYGSPTAAQDLQKFHDTFFPTLPNPSFEAVYPQGRPNFQNGCQGNGTGHSGPCAAAGWSGEATLDIEWAYAIAPRAHIVLIGVPPAETLGVQGFPNLFNALRQAIDRYPAGTVISQGFGATEQAFGGAATVQTARFDAVYQAAAVVCDGRVVKTLPSPVPAELRHRLRGARVAGLAPEPAAGPVAVQRVVSQRGQIQVGSQRLQVGLRHARKRVMVLVHQDRFEVLDQGELLKSVTRTMPKEVTRFKAAEHQARQG